MIDQLTNPGISFRNFPNQGGPRTLIIVGLPRSGTTMVASALDALGVFLGEKADKAVREDMLLVSAFEQSRSESVAVIERYNSMYETWAFKRPQAYKYKSRELRRFRNPHFIVLFRDVLAISKRNEISMMSDFGKQLKSSIRQQSALVKFVLRQKAPMMLVSYEKAMASPTDFSASLSKFSGLQTDDDIHIKAAKAMANGPQKYLRKSQIRFPSLK